MKRLLVGALLIGGCAMHDIERESAKPLPATAQEARSEIERLRARIDALRPRAGLLPRGEVARPSQPTAAPAAVAEETEIARAPSPRASQQRCRDARTAADEICDASERICRLAEQVADDPARRQCDAARGDCAEARRLAEGCR